MTKRRFLGITIIVSMFLALMIYACRKELPSLNHSNSNSIAVQDRDNLDYFSMTSTDISVQNGMLCFKDSVTFMRALESLLQLSSDSAYVDQVLRERGINPEVDTFMYPKCPVYDKFNARFGFTSLRHIKEQENNNQRQIIEGNLLESIYNQYLEVKVGNLIYRPYNEDVMFVISNNDNSVLSDIRAAADPLSIPVRPNFYIINLATQEGVDELDNLKEMAESGCILDFGIERIGTNVLRFTAAPFSIVLRWSVTDNLGNLLGTAKEISVYDFTVPANLPTNAYPLKITLFGDEPCLGKKVSKSTHLNNCLFTTVGISTTPANTMLIDDNESNTYDFSLSGIGSISGSPSGQTLAPGHSILWDFGDGTPPVTTTNRTVSHTFPKILDQPILQFRVCAVLITPNCSQTICATVNVGCGRIPPRIEKVYSVSNPAGCFRIICFTRKTYVGRSHLIHVGVDYLSKDGDGYCSTYARANRLSLGLNTDPLPSGSLDLLHDCQPVRVIYFPSPTVVEKFSSNSHEHIVPSGPIGFRSPLICTVEGPGFFHVESWY